MFLRSKRRHQDGKEHRYWGVVENRRVGSGQVAQRAGAARKVHVMRNMGDEYGLSFCNQLALAGEGAKASAGNRAGSYGILCTRSTQYGDAQDRDP